MKFRIRPFTYIDGRKGFTVQRKEDKWYKMWHWCECQYKGTFTPIFFTTREKAQLWIDKQNLGGR